MINATHYVIDLETLATSNNAAIVSIGIVRVEQARITGSLYLRVDPTTAINHCHQELDYSTVIWWLKQNDAARAELTDPSQRLSLPAALAKVSDFFGHISGEDADDQIYVWGNGDEFDCSILATAYKATGYDLPWHYNKNQNLRTLLELYPAAKALAGEFEGTRHHALHDARHEAKRLCEALKQHAAAQALQVTT